MGIDHAVESDHESAVLKIKGKITSYLWAAVVVHIRDYIALVPALHAVISKPTTIAM